MYLWVFAMTGVRQNRCHNVEESFEECPEAGAGFFDAEKAPQAKHLSDVATGLRRISAENGQPIFELDMPTLAARFEKVALGEPRVEKLSSRNIGADLQVDYVQYSKLIGYPDTITVRFIDLGEGRSTLAIFSRAHYGYRDFGVNEARVRDWMRKLDLALRTPEKNA